MDFVVLNFYGNDGQLVDQIIREFEGYLETVGLIRQEAYVLLQPHLKYIRRREAICRTISRAGFVYSLKISLKRKIRTYKYEN